MKKLIAVLILVISCTLVFAACSSTEDDNVTGGAKETLVIYNWADYMDLTVQDDFCAYYEEVTGNSLEIVYSTFDTNEIMLTQILKGEAQVDLICPSEYAIQKLATSNALQKIDTSVLSQYEVDNNLGNIYSPIYDSINATFTETYEGTNRLSDYLVPYMWGTLGILYNASAVSEEELEESGWGILWNKLGLESIQNKITLKDSVRDVYVAAVLYLKEEGRLPEEYDNLSVQQLINTVDGTLLALVEEALEEQKTALKGYEVDEGKSDVLKEETLVSLAWSGDAMWVIELAAEDDVEIGYYVPDVGANLWFDGWVIPKNANNSLAATMFINYCCDPLIAMRNQIEIGYTSAVDKTVLQASPDAMDYLIEVYEFEDEDYATDYDLTDPSVLDTLINEEEAYISASFFMDEGRYPEITDKLGVMKDFGAQNESAVKMWSRVKSFSKFPWQALVIGLGLVAGIVVFIVIYYFFLNKKLSRRYISK